MSTNDRELVEAALARLRANEEPQWPPIARRFQQARERLDLSLADVAGQLGVVTSEYWDIEFHHDEAFSCFSIVELRKIATILATPLETLLFGSDFGKPTERISPAVVVERLHALAASEGLTIEQLGDRIGWELESVMADPEALWELNLYGLSDVCHAIGVDWVAVLFA